MGFCLVNNVAVTAAALAEQGERVLIVDYDAHHGNGTQDIFYEHPTVFYVSFHQWPLYPGTGAMGERGDGAGFGCNLNIPVPPRATGDVYLAGLDRIVAPLAEASSRPGSSSRPASTPTGATPSPISGSPPATTR